MERHFRCFRNQRVLLIGCEQGDLRKDTVVVQSIENSLRSLIQSKGCPD